MPAAGPESYRPLAARPTARHHARSSTREHPLVRELAALSTRTFDVVVIGGGITGACVARDAARRGLSVALVDKGDFSGATSSGSSKLVHGGLRYIRNLELGLVRESLRERRAWQRIAPHQVHPLPFILPVRSWKERAVSRTGLWLYDMLSFDRRRVEPTWERIPGSSWIPRARLVDREPVLAEPGIKGAIEYGDCQMTSPERLGLECLLDAVAHGSVVANHVEVDGFEAEGEFLAAVVARDRISGGSLRIAGRVFVNATGPWADLLLARTPGPAPSQRLVRSKGIHIVVPPITRGSALLIAHPRGHFFVIPWLGMTLVGTTDTPFDGSPDEVHATTGDVEVFLDVINAALPRAGLSPGKVLRAYAALRPLIASGNTPTYKASRRGEIVDHHDEPGRRNVVSALGGKWTTSRATAETCVDRILQKLGNAMVPCSTASEVLPGARGFDRDDVRKRVAAAGLDDQTAGHLATTYGAQAGELLRLVESDPSLGRRISPRLPDIEAEVVHSVRAEMALTLEDILLRRTSIAAAGALEPPALRRVAGLARRELGWTEGEAEAQLALVRRHDWPPA